MVKHWFLTKSTEKTLSLNDLNAAKVTYNYSSENSNFSNDFNDIKNHLNNTKLKPDQWIKEHLVKPSQTLSDEG